MGDYLRITRAYLCGTAAAVWLFMFLCLLTVCLPTASEELARSQSAVLGGVLSRKSYLAMFAYFNSCLLGVLLRDNIAHPWASVLPHYREKHLLVTALIALLFLGVPMLSMEFVGTSDIAPASVAVIFLTCLTAGLWTLHHPTMGILPLPFLVFVMVPSESFPGLAVFLAGTAPAASAVLAFTSLLSLWALAWRLLAMNEDTFEYAIARVLGDFLRGRGQTFAGQAKIVADYLDALPADKRAVLQDFDPLKKPFTNLKQVENLSGYRERSVWQRSQLWRLGTAPTRTSVSVAGQILVSFIIISPMVLFAPLMGPEIPASSVLVIMSAMVMTNPFNIWLLWFTRRSRLGYESLRPRTRQEFVRELGLALLWDNIQCWLGGVLLIGIAAAIWAQELLQVERAVLIILGSGVGQLCVYAAMGIWLLKLSKRGMLAGVSCAFCPFVAMSIWMLYIAQPVGSELKIAIGLVLIAVSAAAIALAYRRWCGADLD